MIVVSACLAGVPCRYDGTAKPCKEVMELVRRGEAVLVCPEELGGLSTPRPPSEVQNASGEDVLLGKARILTNDGIDVTEAFVRGAQKALEQARLAGAKRAVLKANSPSCGCGSVYDGTFSGTLRAGNGVTAALFLQNGMEVEAK